MNQWERCSRKTNDEGERVRECRGCVVVCSNMNQTACTEQENSSSSPCCRLTRSAGSSPNLRNRVKRCKARCGCSLDRTALEATHRRACRSGAPSIQHETQSRLRPRANPAGRLGGKTRACLGMGLRTGRRALRVVNYYTYNAAYIPCPLSLRPQKRVGLSPFQAGPFTSYQAYRHTGMQA
jgi:hypothetical protein